MWVLQQVEEKIVAGFPVERSTNIFTDEEADGEVPFKLEETLQTRRRGKPAQMMSIEQWPDSQRLRFLIDAIRHAVVHAAEIERESLRLLQSFAPVDVIRFEGDDASLNRPVLMMSRDHGKLVAQLKVLLDSLEDEVQR